MQAFTTEGFLRSKLGNMKTKLRSHGASAEKLEQMEAHIRQQDSLTAYACQLNEQGRDFVALADKLLGFCEVPAKHQPAARKCVVSYLICFAESTCSLAAPH